MYVMCVLRLLVFILFSLVANAVESKRQPVINILIIKNGTFVSECVSFNATVDVVVVTFALVLFPNTQPMSRVSL